MAPGYGYGHGQQRRGNRRGDPYFWLLVSQLLQQIQRLDYKPPVTLGLMAVNTAVFILPDIPIQLIPKDLRWLYRLVPTISSGCLRPESVIRLKQWSRLFWSALLHADEWHLYYNMSSLLWKGLQLEAALGHVKYALLILELWLTSSALYCVFTWAAVRGLLPSLIQSYWDICSVGFSGVLFGMKMVLNMQSMGWERVSIPFIGQINMPPKYAAYIELLVIQFFHPEASFLGHLCGILAGVIHVKFTAALMDRLYRGLTSQGGSGQRRRFHGSGRSGYHEYAS